MTIVDEDGVWWGIVDHLWCVWFINNSIAVSPYWAKHNQFLKRNFQNIKTQCYFELARVVNDKLMYIDCDAKIQSDIIEELDIVVQVDIDKDSKIKIISKEDIKDKLWRSPDYADALMMRMYFNLIFEWIEQIEEEPEYRGREYESEWKMFTLDELMEEVDLQIDDSTL